MRMTGVGTPNPVRDIGRYRVYDEIASGGMATVSFGRLLGPVGFSRTVAIKELHAQFAKDPEFVAMFLDEARLAARIHHPNVVPTLDVVAEKGHLMLVMDYVHGESLARLMRASPTLIPPKITAAIIAGALHGLHAAHEARSERGQPLGIVHRDISPQNILVGVDGVPRVLDFGVAKAANRLQTTQEGHLKGKVRYMSPEQVSGLEVDRQTDIYAMAVVLFEMATGRAMFPKAEPAAIVNEIISGIIPHPKAIAPETPDALDAIIMRGLARNPAERFANAHDMALALEEEIGLATPTQIAAWVQALVRDKLALRAATVSAIESSSSNEDPPPISQTPTSIISTPAASHSQGQLPEAPTGKTAFAAPPPAPPKSSIGLTIALLVFASLAVLGIGLIVVVLRRPLAPTPAASTMAAPPPTTPTPTSPTPTSPTPMPDVAATSSAPIVEEPLATAAVGTPTLAASVSPSASASAKRPAVVRPPPVKPKEDDMARSRR